MEMRLRRNNPRKAKEFFESKLMFSTGPAELKFLLDKGIRPIIVDVRESKDFFDEHIPGSVNLPQAQWKSLKGLSKDQQHIIYCYSNVCHLGAKACAFFASQGYSVMEMDGGMESWRDHQFPVETELRKSA